MMNFQKKENVFRQIAEEKPYLVFPFNEKCFYSEAKRRISEELS